VPRAYKTPRQLVTPHDHSANRSRRPDEERNPAEKRLSGALVNDSPTRCDRTLSASLKKMRRGAVTLKALSIFGRRICDVKRFFQRRQRHEIFQVEDSIMAKRDALIDSLERRLAQKTESVRLFTIEWAVC